MISSSLLAQIQDRYTQLMTSVCLIKRAATGRGVIRPDDTAQWPTVAQVPCFVSELRFRPREADEGGAIEPVRHFNVDVPLGTDIRVTDRLLITDSPNVAIIGNEFEVTDVDSGRSLRPALRVSVTRAHSV